MIRGTSKSQPPTRRIPHGVCVPSRSRTTANSCNLGAGAIMQHFLLGGWLVGGAVSNERKRLRGMCHELQVRITSSAHQNKTVYTERFQTIGSAIVCRLSVAFSQRDFVVKGGGCAIFTRSCPRADATNYRDKRVSHKKHTLGKNVACVKFIRATFSLSSASASAYHTVAVSTLYAWFAAFVIYVHAARSGFSGTSRHRTNRRIY